MNYKNNYKNKYKYVLALLSILFTRNIGIAMKYNENDDLEKGNQIGKVEKIFSKDPYGNLFDPSDPQEQWRKGFPLVSSTGFQKIYAGSMNEAIDRSSFMRQKALENLSAQAYAHATFLNAQLSNKEPKISIEELCQNYRQTLIGAIELMKASCDLAHKACSLPVYYPDSQKIDFVEGSRH